MPRKIDPLGRTKTARIDCRMTEYEKVVICEKAKSMNMYKGEYLVHLGMGYEVEVLPSKVTEEFLSELCRIGNNINQLTRNSNVVKKNIDKATDAQLKNVLDQFNRHLEQVAKKLSAIEGAL